MSRGGNMRHLELLHKWQYVTSTTDARSAETHEQDCQGDLVNLLSM